MPRRSSVTATTALAVGAIACALPGALAGSNAPRGFPRDCVKEAMLGKCVAGDKVFGDTPDPEVIDVMKDLLFNPLMSGPDDAATLSGFSKFFKKAKKKAASAIKPIKVDEKLKKAAAEAAKKAKKAAEEAAEKAKKTADALKGDSDKKQKETDEVEKAVKTAEDAVEAAKKKLADAMKKRDAKAIKKAKAALDGLKGKADIQKKKFKGFKEAAQKAAKAAQKAMEDAKKRIEDMKKSQDAALAEGEIPGDMYTEGEIPGDMNTAPDSEQVSTLKSALQGCDVSTIAQCMMDTNVPEAQAKGKEIKNMISGLKWKSIDVACSYKSVNGKPSCEDLLLKNKPKSAIPRRARLGAEQAQGQTGAAYVAVIASVAAFAGYTVYQRRQQDEPLPTYEGYGTM